MRRIVARPGVAPSQRRNIASASTLASEATALPRSVSGRSWPRRNLRDVLTLRAIAIGGVALALGFAYPALGGRLPLPVIGVIASLAVFTLASGFRLARGAPVSERTFLVQLLADLVALAAIFYFTGGSSNPFVSLFILPITVAAATLGRRARWVTVGAAVAAYTALMFRHVPLPESGRPSFDFAVHVWGMWCGFVLSAGLVAFFVARIANALRAHDRDLSEAREQVLRADRWLALGTLAAGAAHELGTPLATMAVLTTELEKDPLTASEQIGTFRLLRRQIDRCKKILARMAVDAGEVQADEGRSVRIDRYLGGLLQQWQALRPNARLRSEFSGSEPAPRILADRTVDQAILAILDNAADASAHDVKLEACWDGGNLRIAVRDRGEGISTDVRRDAGHTIATTKAAEGGLGLGLFLARASLERLGGKIHLRDRQQGGVCAEITLPLEHLRISAGA